MQIQSIGNSLTVMNDKVIMNGKEVILPEKLKNKLKRGQSCISQYNNNLVINGYVYKNGEFKFSILQFLIHLF